MPRSTVSLRFDDGLRERLGAAAAAEGTTVTALVERFVREGWRWLTIPGSCSSLARRAAARWRVDRTCGRSPRRCAACREPRPSVTALAAEFGLHERQVVAALHDAAANREEIEARIGANDRALAEAERVAVERQRLLA